MLGMIVLCQLSHSVRITGLFCKNVLKSTEMCTSESSGRHSKTSIVSCWHCLASQMYCSVNCRRKPTFRANDNRCSIYDGPQRLRLRLNTHEQKQQAASLTERNNRLAHSRNCNYLLPVQNLTSLSCSATPISYKNDDISGQFCLVFEI